MTTHRHLFMACIVMCATTLLLAACSQPIRPTDTIKPTPSPLTTAPSETNRTPTPGDTGTNQTIHLSGQVLSTDSKPIANVPMTFERTGITGDKETVQTISNADGHYEMTLQLHSQDMLLITMQAEGYILYQQTFGGNTAFLQQPKPLVNFILRSNAELTQTPTLIPPPGTGTVTLIGQVLDGSVEPPKPIPGAQVTIEHLSISIESGTEHAVTDAEGKYEITMRVHDTDLVIVRVQAAGYKTYRQDLTGLKFFGGSPIPQEIQLQPN